MGEGNRLNTLFHEEKDRIWRCLKYVWWSVLVRRRLVAVLGAIDDFRPRIWLASVKEGILEARTVESRAYLGLRNVQGQRQLCTGPAPLMGEPEGVRRASAGSPISGAGKDHLIFNKKGLDNGGKCKPAAIFLRVLSLKIALPCLKSQE